MIQLGRFDELGSGMRNLAHYLPLYNGGAAPTFREEGMIFVSDLPLVSGKEKSQSAIQSANGLAGEILNILLADPNLTLGDVAVRLKYSVRSIKEAVKQLVEGKRLRRIGSKRYGCWEVLDVGHADPPTGVAETRAIDSAEPSFQSAKGSGKTSVEMSGKILELLSDNPQLTLTEAATRLDVSTRTVERHVATLKQQNRLTRTGSRKDGRWEVAE